MRLNNKVSHIGTTPMVSKSTPLLQIVYWNVKCNHDLLTLLPKAMTYDDLFNRPVMNSDPAMVTTEIGHQNLQDIVPENVEYKQDDVDKILVKSRSPQ